MLASLTSFAGRVRAAFGRILPARQPMLRWTDEGGAQVAVWTAPDTAGPGVAAVRLEIAPTDAARLPFDVRVCPEGYVTRSFLVGDLEIAHTVALEQLALAQALPAIAGAEVPVPGATANEDSAPAMTEPVVPTLARPLRGAA